MGRFQDLIKDIPLFTFSLIIFCSIVFIFSEFIIGQSMTQSFSENPYYIVEHYQIYRLFTGQLLHGSIWHILMNMFAMYSFGCSIEKSFGTIRFFFINVAILIMGGIFYCAYHYLIALIPYFSTAMHRSAVGYSGVLFGLAVIETTFTTAEKRSVFGCFDVPTRLYPLVLALLIQVLIPGTSFVGHLCGILAGFMCLQGWLCFLIPSVKLCQRIQDSRYFSCIYHLSPFAITPNNDTLSSGSVAFRELLSIAWYYIKTGLLFVKNLLGCLFTCGRQSSSSRPTTTTSTTGRRNAQYTRVSTTEDSDQWNKSQPLFSGQGHKLNEEL